MARSLAGAGVEGEAAAAGHRRACTHRRAASPRSVKRLGFIAVALCLLVASCTNGVHRSARNTALNDNVVTIGSFDFAESELLAEIYAQALERDSFKVKRIFRLGPRELVQPALAQGLIEFVPEYLGTALSFLRLEDSASLSDVAAAHDVLTEVLAEDRLAALASSRAQDANAFVVTRRLSERYGLTALSDLKDVAGSLTLGGPPECQTRSLCLIGLREVYGLEFDDFLPLDAGGPLTHEALRHGYADVALLFTTDPALRDRNYVVLADDRKLQPVENVTPLVRQEVLDRWPELAHIVDRVSSRLTTSQLRRLNAQTAEGMSPSTAAATWLSSLEEGP